eukprot:5435872-Amphidinium_carterae.1
MIWAGLRFSDLTGAPFDRLKLDDIGLSGVLEITKTTGPDKAVRSRDFYVSRKAYLIHGNWLQTGFQLWADMSFDISMVH